MEIYSVLITGANRGIGLELTRQLANYKNPVKHVFATYRSEATAENLKAIQNSACPETEVHLIKMDITVPSEVEEGRKVIEEVVGDNGLTVLINNAGVVQWIGYPDVTPESLFYHFNTNTVGPILVAQAMLPLLKKASSRSTKPGMSFSRAAILNISSIAGCISTVGVSFSFDLGTPGYKISKAALNMAMRVLAEVIKEDNILVVNMCPGWVKTDLGSQDAELLPRDSIGTILETISKLDESNNGTYMDRFGKPYDW